MGLVALGGKKGEVTHTSLQHDSAPKKTLWGTYRDEVSRKNFSGLHGKMFLANPR